MMMRMVDVAIVGASGFTGAELLRLAALHPDVRVVTATGDTHAGQPVASLHPSLAAHYGDRRFARLDVEGLDGLDVVFCCLPPTASMALVARLVGRVGCVVDLSAAYRLKDAAQYPLWYGFEHDQTELLAEAVYGLPELDRTKLPGARLVATPGCYVTAAALALAPLVRAGAVEATGLIVDAASGASGAGRNPSDNTTFCAIDENFTAYGLLDHRHTPEIEQCLGGAQVVFTPHLAPMNRGILATCYGRPPAADRQSTTTETVLGVLGDAYASEPFVTVIDSPPSTKATLGANTVLVTGRYDERTGTVIAIAALDNLTKGASGGAIQSANVAIGLAETAGLPTVGLMP